LNFAVFIKEMTPKAVASAREELFFHKGTVETDQYIPGAYIFHMDFEGFHGPKTEPIVCYYPDHGTNRGETAEFPQGNLDAPVFPIPGVMAEQFPQGDNPQPGKGPGGCGTGALNMVQGRGKLPEIHGGNTGGFLEGEPL
jgi:hypothetical protein